MKTIKREGLIVASFVFAIMVIGIVSASGVGYPYWENNQVKMTPGESQTINLNLQNNVGDSDITYVVTVREGASIASLAAQNTYLVRAHTTNTAVPLVLSVPDDAKVGDKIKVGLNFESVADNTATTGTSVSLSQGMSLDFEVVVVQKPAHFPTTWLIVGIVVVILLIWLISAGRKKGKR